MSACQCSERRRPIRDRRWVIVEYRCNYSAFSGYSYARSDYSALHCQACDADWRTKAAYVVLLAGLTPAELEAQ